MTVHPLAGKPAPPDLLVDVPALEAAYADRAPRPDAADEQVAFGTSGHRGSSLQGSFNEHHILAICQAICTHRQAAGIEGPLFVGIDTHALSRPALETAVEVFAANRVAIRVQAGLGYTPTPVVSHAILTHNRGRQTALADGVVITPSHNPPADGGFKYNPPSGGPADQATTAFIESQANALIADRLREVRRIPFERAIRADTTEEHDYVAPYVEALGEVVDMEAIRRSGVTIGVDPLGGSGLGFWAPIADRYGLDLTVVNDRVDPTFSFMPVDRDGRIRMDCSSRFAMAGLIALKDRFQVAVGNDPDADRHGIVTRTGGLMNPNHYLAAAIGYLYRHRPGWGPDVAVGKTLVSSAMIDRVAADLGRAVIEVPVGFKWFVELLLTGRAGFCGEESAGASMLRRDGTVWTTDKDGIVLGLLAAEMTAVLGQDPEQLYRDLEARFGAPAYERLDVPADRDQRRKLGRLPPEAIRADTLAGEPIRAVLTRAPGNNAPIGGLKVEASSGWFAVRPSGTEDIYKIYAESFLGAEHVRRIQEEARQIVAAALETGA